MNQPLSGLAPMHPGELLREDILPALAMREEKVARLIAISRQTLSEILAETQDITPAMALRFGTLTGTAPEMWIAMQHNYGLRVQATKDATSARASRSPRA